MTAPSLHHNPVLSPTISSASSSWLSWAGDDVAVLRSLAVFLPFADAGVAVPLPSARGHHSSFLSLARTCRRAYEVLTSDAECWSTQRLRFELTEHLMEQGDFADRLGFSGAKRFALLVDRFTARRRETMRRLVGADVFDRLIAPHLSSTSCVRLAHTIDGESGTADVFPDLTSRVFANSELQRLRWSYNGTQLEGTDWLRGCYSFLLLPPCIRLTTAASVTMRYVSGTPYYYLNCLYRLLHRLPAVERLTLEGAQPLPITSPLEWEWSPLHTALPRLRSLSVVNVPVRWENVLRPLMTAELGELRELTIDSEHTFPDRPRADGRSWNERMTFHFPPRSDETTEAATDSAALDRRYGSDKQPDIRAEQLRLRIALCRDVLEQLDSALRREVPDVRRLSRIRAECRAIERQLIEQQQQ